MVEEAKTAQEKYPYPEFETELIDPKLNKWKVTKVNQFFYLIKEGSEVVQIPTNRIYDLNPKGAKITFDNSNQKQIWVRASENIWPESEELKNAKISVKIPDILINGHLIRSRTLVFDMDYESVKSKHKNSPAIRCPSTSLIFHWND